MTSEAVANRVRTPYSRVLTRVAGIVIVIWGAATLSFLVLHLTPGDPVDIMLGTQSTASPELKESIRVDMGLDRPVAEQYVSYLGNLAKLDFGQSYRLQKPVIEVLGEQLPSTLQLAGLAIVISVGLALLIAYASRRARTRSAASLLELVAVSFPSFWTGILLLTVFSFQLRWFPVAGGSGFGALVLPAVTLALPIAGILSQVLRHGLEVANEQPFVSTAQARGLSFGQLLSRHTLRHAALPVVTLSGYIVGGMLGGAVIVEQLFGRSGLGRVTLDAITNRDLPVVMALVVLAAVVFVVVNLVVDLVYPLLDPRLRSAR